MVFISSMVSFSSGGLGFFLMTVIVGSSGIGGLLGVLVSFGLGICLGVSGIKKLNWSLKSCSSSSSDSGCLLGGF